MLNELLDVHRALAGAGVSVSMRHPDVKDVGRRATLLVRLRADGSVWRVQARNAEEAAQLWTIRDGQHNSFPYHQIKHPLLRVSPDDERLEIVRGKRTDEAKRWAALLSLARDADLNEEAFTGWPGTGYLSRLTERHAQLASLAETAAGGAPAAFERFMRAAAQPSDLLRGIADALVSEMRRGNLAELPLATALLADGGGPLYFDVDRDFDRLAGDERNVTEISRALGGGAEDGPGGICALSGRRGSLVSDKFPQPNLPILGQTYLFARNKDAPTNARYGRTSTDAVAIGSEEASALQAAIEAVTREEWKDRTWRSIPGERPKQFDLFIAFVPGEEQVPLAALLTEDLAPEPVPGAEERFASFSERLVKAFKGKVKERADTRLSLLVLRRLDPANRKAVYSQSLTVRTLVDAAHRWSEGCQNVPGTIRLLVPGGRGEPARPSPPREIAPLSLTPLTRRLFIRGGTQVQEVVGRTADEAMRLFLAPRGATGALDRTLLRYVLHSRGTLLQGVGHAQTRGFDDLKAFDRREALDTVTLLGLLLHRLGRTKEVYMEEVAFKLGRLLAAADALHAGYNASERGGSALPPRLMGNAVLPLAQSDPFRALEVLGRRWAVYHGWAQRNAGFRVPEPKAGGGERDAKAQQETARAWQIRNGITAARRARWLAEDLHGKLPSRGEVPDHFRAELLLGYVAGPPRGDEAGTQDRDNNDTPQQGDE